MTEPNKELITCLQWKIGHSVKFEQFDDDYCIAGLLENLLAKTPLKKEYTDPDYSRDVMFLAINLSIPKQEAYDLYYGNYFDEEEIDEPNAMSAIQALEDVKNSYGLT